MNTKENYKIKLKSISSDFSYDDLISENVISIDDVNNLKENINLNIDILTGIQNNQFCQFVSDPYAYIEIVSDRAFPRVKYFNDQTNNIKIVSADSTINGHPLSDYKFNLLTQNNGQNFITFVNSINGAVGNVNGIQQIVVNGETYSYTQNNQGVVNLRNLLTGNNYLKTINGQSGNLFLPSGITFNGKTITCKYDGILDISEFLDSYLNTTNKTFETLYIENVDEENLNSVINLKYFQDHKDELEIKSHNTTLTYENIVTNNKIKIHPINDNNFVSYIYGIQDSQYKKIIGYGLAESEYSFQIDLYKNGIPLTFVLLEKATNSSCVLKLNKFGSPGNVSLRYSKNFSNYDEFSLTNGIEINLGDVISLSGINNSFSQNTQNYYYFSISNSTKFACYGNVMSLVNWNKNITNNNQFICLFRDSNIVKAPQLPATVLTQGCYQQMFSGCVSLIVPPQLPATTMTSKCYYCMFNACSSLSTVPLLPATELAPSCYYAMFYGCESLTILPYYLLPATQLKDWCYTSMFGGCTNLTDGPLLPAYIPPYNSDGTCPVNYNNCYGNMFYRSKNLSAVHVNCTPGLLLQKPLPSYMPTTTEEEREVARAWLQTHNYANEWLYNFRPGTDTEGVPNEDHIPITMYSTALWNEMRGYANGVEKFYYSPYTNDNFNYYNVKTIARSLQDTPLSFELISGVSDGAFCFRSLQYVLSSKEYKNHTYTNQRNKVLNMNAKFKYYDKTTKILVSSNTQDANGWNTQNFSWTTQGTSYTLTHDKYPFNNTTSGKNGLIFSLSSDSFSQGLVNENTSSAKILFWRLCHKNNCKFKIMGNLNSLIGGRNYVNPYQFFSLFSDIKCGEAHHAYGFIDAHQLILPATTLGKSCYQNMFAGCTGLKNGPLNLPANTISQSCYENMFSGCTAIQRVPYIQAKNLQKRCCYNIFSNCSNLTLPPIINNINYVSDYSYVGAFSGCTNLLYFQDLNTSDIQSQSYQQMFLKCSNLIYPPSLNSKNINSQGCYEMFAGCSSLKYIPPLLMNNIKNNGNYCFTNMFSGCINANGSHAYLPITNLTLGCYNYMFKNTPISGIVVKFTNWNNSTTQWLDNVSLCGNFYCYDQLDTTSRGTSRVPPSGVNHTGWDVYKSLKGINLTFEDHDITQGNMQLFYLRKK